MAIKGTLYGLTKTKSDIDGKEQFKSMIKEVNASGVVVIDGRNIAAGSIFANQISADAITAKQIKSDSITTDHISTAGISADKIKAGSLTASNGKSTINLNDGTFNFGSGKFVYNGKSMSMQVDSLTIDGLKGATENKATEIANSAVESLEIGGRNLLTKSDTVFGYFSGADGTPVSSGLEGGSNQDFRIDEYIKVIEGEQFVFTVYTKKEIVSIIYLGVFIHFYSEDKVWRKAVLSDTAIRKERLSIIFTAEKDGYIRVNSRGFKDFNHKLEKGNKATDWSPAPEDVDAGIASAQGDATNAKGKTDAWTHPGTTEINGGKIRANTVTATQIAANTITATQITTAGLSADIIKAGMLTSSNGVTKINMSTGDFNFGSGKVTLVGSNLSLNVDSLKITNKAVATEEKASAIAEEAKSKNLGYRYTEDIVIYGDSKKYYPVVIKGGDQTVKRDIIVKRAYSEQAPPDWYSSTHKGGLTLKIKTNFGGWGGANYSWEIHELEEVYSSTFAGAVLTGNSTQFAIFLRGGGTVGAIYHIYSDQSLTENNFNTDGTVARSPQVAMPGDKIFDYNHPNGTYYKVLAPEPRTLTAEVEEEIRIRKFIDLSKQADLDAKNAKGKTDAWTYPNTTEINGGSIRTNTITAKEIAGKTITASHIATGSLTASDIKTGMLESKNGVSKINMDTGDFSFGGGKISLAGNKITLNVDSLSINAKPVATQDYTKSTNEDIQTEISNSLETKADRDAFELALADLALAKSQAEDALSSNTYNEFLTGYEDYRTAVAQDQINASNAFQAVLDTVTSIENNMGETSEKWKFLDTSITNAEGGIKISSEASAMSVLISPDRISFFDNLTEVAFISDKVLQINHGVFLMSVQVGAHLISSLPEDNNITVVQWVGIKKKK